LKRTKIISDLLISVSKAERQEARLKVRQDSLRLGNVGVIRYRWSIVKKYIYLFL
jgi:tousled-like kinase